MLRIVIAMASDDFGHMLEKQLNTEHSVIRCFDGNTALDLLEHLRPDVLLLDLSLPLLDGLSMLEQAQSCLPGVVIGLTEVASDSICARAEELGISRLYLLPVNADIFMKQLHKQLEQTVAGASREINIQRRTLQLLNKLSFKPNLTGYQQILVGIPLVIKDISIPMCKELYPKIAQITGLSSSRPIEHTIRTVIHDAWESGDKELWLQYFPIPANRKRPYPSNKQFFTAIANILTME
ncbi:MAG: response regulator [Ruminococcaceae bacterium]|nr:response regulator [Oscillospiraceae bacterium]